MQLFFWKIFLFYEKKFNYNGKRFRFEQPITRLVNARLCLWFVVYKKKRKSPDISGFSSCKKVSSFLFTCGGGNRTRQSAERDCLQAEAERAVWPRSQPYEVWWRQMPSSSSSVAKTSIKKPIRHWCGLVKCGGGNRTRTCDLTDVNRVL